jgi:hypothetical protein
MTVNGDMYGIFRFERPGWTRRIDRTANLIVLKRVFKTYLKHALLPKAVRSILRVHPGDGGLIIGFGAPKLSFGSGKPILKFSTNFT